MVLDNNAIVDLDFQKIVSAIDNTLTSNGSATLKSILTTPTSDTTELSRRKSCLVKCESKLGDTVDSLLKTIKDCHSSVLWFGDKNAPEKEWLQTTYLPKIIRAACMNHPKVSLLYAFYKTIFTPMLAIVSPLLYILIPYVYIRFVCKMPIPFTLFVSTFFRMMVRTRGSKELTLMAVSMFMYGQGVVNAVETAALYIKVNKFIWKKYQDLTAYIDAATKLTEIFKDVNMSCFGLPQDCKWDTGSVPSVKKPYTIFADVGDILSHIHEFDCSEIQGLVEKVSYIDALVSVVKAKERLKMQYSIIVVGGQYPRIKTTNMWHVAIQHDPLGGVVVKNDIDMGGDDVPNNVILTGPNAAGKSSFLKSLIVNVMLSQSICMCAADHFEYTPFSKICTHMNVPDMNGKASLFEAEMHRCKEKLDTMKKIPSNQFVLYAMDEVFSSTQPIEGVAGAHAVLRRMATYRNSMGLVSTHFVDLTKLAEVEDFENYKMVVDHDENGNIVFPYKLQKGVSDQHIALELLRREGFDKEIITEAIDVRNRLCGNTPLCGNTLCGNTLCGNCVQNEKNEMSPESK